MARNPFLSGLMGGMLGAGLIGMMFGGGFAGGLGGGAGMLGLLLQVLLIGGVAYLAVRLFRGWSAARAQPAGPAYAYAAAPGPMAEARRRGALASGAAGGSCVAQRVRRNSPSPRTTTTTFESLLSDIQTAYSKGDLARMRGLATPEMLGYFSEAAFRQRQPRRREQGRGGEARAGRPVGGVERSRPRLRDRRHALQHDRRDPQRLPTAGSSRAMTVIAPRRRRSGPSCAAAAASGSCRPSSKPSDLSSLRR